MTKTIADTEFPERILPGEMLDPEHTYFVAIGALRVFRIIGPFRIDPSVPPVKITDVPPLNGQLRYMAFFAGGERKGVMIPKNGRAVIYGMTYALCPDTPACRAYFASLTRDEEDLRATEGNCKWESIPQQEQEMVA